MKLTREEVLKAADGLFEAELSRRQIGLLSLLHPAMDIDDAYAVQAALTQRKLNSGRRIVGWKIGLTSRAMQQALGIDTPDTGVLFDDMAFESGAQIPAGRFIQPRVEAEIAFVIKSPLSGSATTAGDVMAATGHVAPVLEILDTRIVRRDEATGATRRVVDTIADNAANAGFVLGKARHAPGDHDLKRAGAIVSCDGEVVETGLGAGVLGDPANSVAWLARRLAAYGQEIGPGQIVLSGSFIRPIECPPGTAIVADFGTFGEIGVTFGR
jgi:2-oxo-hept-3-ene-1,7-dioate hydratase